MYQRRKRFLVMFAKNLTFFMGIALLIVSVIAALALITKLAVSIWGQEIGLTVFGLLLSVIGFSAAAFMKAKEDLHLAEIREKHTADLLSRPDDYWIRK